MWLIIWFVLLKRWETSHGHCDNGTRFRWKPEGLLATYSLMGLLIAQAGAAIWNCLEGIQLGLPTWVRYGRKKVRFHGRRKVTEVSIHIFNADDWIDLNLGIMISLQLVMHKFATVTSFWQVMKFFDSIVKLFISGYLSKISVKRWGWWGHLVESQEKHETFQGFLGTWNNTNRPGGFGTFPSTKGDLLKLGICSIWKCWTCPKIWRTERPLLKEMSQGTYVHRHPPMTFRISGLLCMSRQFSVGASSDIRPPGREGDVRRCEMTCVQSTKLKSIIFFSWSNKRASCFPTIYSERR